MLLLIRMLRKHLEMMKGLCISIFVSTDLRKAEALTSFLMFVYIARDILIWKQPLVMTGMHI